MIVVTDKLLREQTMDHPIIYKLILAPEWEASKKEGIYKGSALDQADGYMHCSTADQIQGTLDKFFAGQTDVILLSIDTNKIKQHLKWEKSPRSGRIFPHLYGPLPLSAVIKEEKVA
ncbi:MAG: DUF952 domain-containing protein [Alphaproteobacteria bacterium]|nr:DUF952 domain-containing protein [Alphaproteobacteria bacterium]